MMKRLIADRAANLPRLREILKPHAAVRTCDVGCILLGRILLLITAEDALEEIHRRHIFLLRTKNRCTIARSTAHTYIFFTSTTWTDLHYVHDRVIAAAFLTNHKRYLSIIRKAYCLYVYLYRTTIENSPVSRSSSSAYERVPPRQASPSGRDLSPSALRVPPHVSRPCHVGRDSAPLTAPSPWWSLR